MSPFVPDPSPMCRLAPPVSGCSHIFFNQNQRSTLRTQGALVSAPDGTAVCNGMRNRVGVLAASLPPGPASRRTAHHSINMASREAIPPT